MGLIEHAKREFEVQGWPGDDVDSMQKIVCDNIMELIEVFSKQGHSGTTAPYVINLFKRLAGYEPISPLTGEDNEWRDVGHDRDSGDSLFQNKRATGIFKDKSGAYWSDAVIFRDPDGGTYVNVNSRGPIEFPWTWPEKREIIDVDKDGNPF